MSNWQPIETAPRDGTRILLLTGSSYAFSGSYEADEDDSENDGWVDDGGSWWEPHRWQPLPDPPEPTP